MNLRRLPFWVLSRAQHVARWGIHPDYQPIPMDSPKQLSESAFPDSRLALFTDNGRLHIDRWLRMEELAEDFLEFISGLTEVSDDARAKVNDLAPVNALRYDHEIGHWFSQEQIETMYEHNPTWAELERVLYGGGIQARLAPRCSVAAPGPWGGTSPFCSGKRGGTCAERGSAAAQLPLRGM